MNLIYIANARLPTEKAHGFQIVTMCQEYAALDMPVELITPYRVNAIATPLAEFYGLKRQLFRHRVLPGFDAFALFPPRWHGVAYWVNYLVFFIGLLFTKLPTTETWIITRELPLVWLLKKRGYRVAYECHDGLGAKSGAKRFLMKSAVRVIATNIFIKQSLVQHGVDEQKIIVAPNGVSLETFGITTERATALAEVPLETSLKEQILSGLPVLVYTGSFTTKGEDKGLDDILKALPLLRTKVHFIAVGGSERDRSYYHERVHEAGLDDRVTLVTRVDQVVLALFQRVAHALLMPFPRRAHYEYHMSPLKTFEYMASGRPIIASELPSIQAILPPTAAFFVPPDSPAELAKTIDNVLAHPEEGEKRAHEARKLVENFSWTARARHILNALMGTNFA